MATTVTKYASLKKYFGDGTLVFDTNCRLALVTSSYTPDAANHTIWADVSANEVANGSGYTTGGVALTNVVITNTAWDADDVTWTSLTKTFRYGVLYRLGTYNGIVDPLLLYVLYDDTPADISVTGVDFIHRFSVNGVIQPS